MNKKNMPCLPDIFFWIRHIFLTITGIFFLLFGFQVLYSAYQLDDPYLFILTFFASNFIILISAALLVGFLFRIRQALKRNREPE